MQSTAVVCSLEEKVQISLGMVCHLGGVLEVLITSPCARH